MSYQIIITKSFKFKIYSDIALWKQDCLDIYNYIVITLALMIKG